MNRAWRKSLLQLLGQRAEQATGAVLRICLGFVLWGGYAWPKAFEVSTGDGAFLGLIESVGVPRPELWAGLAMLAQGSGAVLLAVGAWPQVGAVLVLSTLVVGIPVVHWGDPFTVVEAGVIYLPMLTLFVLRGGGLYASDELIRGRPHEIPARFRTA